jgi:DNA-binding HxlR family transcriptional regulator
MEYTVHLSEPLQRRDRWKADECSIGRALEVVGTRSALLILREAFYETARFDDFAERAGVSEPVAAARLREMVGNGLREMVGNGLLERVAYQEPGHRARQGYRLTEKGAELLPVLTALMQWGGRWLTSAGGPVAILHRECGEPVQAELRCTAGHRPEVGELDLAPGPGSLMRSR